MKTKIINGKEYEVGPGADLSGADLRNADLRGADLDGADLTRADLTRADLWRANLQGAYLRNANLSGADLRRANLRDADLRDANLKGADLSGADLSGAYLKGADLSEAMLPTFQIPQTGTLTVWKACQGVLVRLLIPAKAKRTASLVGRKCRAEYAKVLWTAKPLPVSWRKKGRITYATGEIVRPDKYDDDPRVECTHGIHFFLTKEEAERSSF